MNYEKLYLKMCRESGHKRFIPTQAILDCADKELEAKDRQNRLLKEKVADSESLVIDLEAKSKRLECAEATIKRIYATYQQNTAVSPVTMAESYLNSYDLFE